MKKMILSVLAMAAMSTTVMAQKDFKMPAPSPSTIVKQDFSTSQIEIEYSRPSMRDREIFGELIPYGKVWRTGANGATKLTFGEDVSLNGQALKAGTYALYTIPKKDKWTVIINKGISNWGASGFDEKDDVMRFDVAAKSTANAVETFTIAVENMSNTSCDIVLAWENTQIAIPVTTQNEERIVKYLEESINQPKLPYAQAANYYLEIGKHLDKALVYADKALEQSPHAFWLYYTKARIYAKQGKKADAIAAGKKCVELASGTPYAEEYKKNIEKLNAAM